MRKSPGKWIKHVLFGKKSSKGHLSRGREKTGNEKEVLISAKEPEANFAVGPPVVSHPTQNVVDKNEEGVEINKEAATLSHERGTSFDQEEEIAVSNTADAPYDPERALREQAAAKVQAAFRGYLARRAFWALKGIIRLQALIRGHLVRRQSVVTLSCMLGVVKFQAIIRGRIVRSSEVGREVQKICSTMKALELSSADPVAAALSARMARLSVNAFIHKLLASSPTVKPLHLHIDSADQNSVSSWLERWSASSFWKPIPQPKKVQDSKSLRKQGNGVDAHAGKSRRTRRLPSANVESVSMQSSSEVEKPRRNLRKISSHPAEPTPENPQNELEKVKRSLRKVHNPVVENSVQSEVENGKAKEILEKASTVSGHEISERASSNSSEKAKKEPPVVLSNTSEKVKKESPVVLSNTSEKVKKESPVVLSNTSEKVKKESPVVLSYSSEKVKKEPTLVLSTSAEKLKEEPTVALPDAETAAEPFVTSEAPKMDIDDTVMGAPNLLAEISSNEKNITGDEADVDSKLLSRSFHKEEKNSLTNGELGHKDDLIGNENNKSGRKSSTPAKQERVENGVQNSPTLPSYMATTESAKAKLRVQGSPRFGQQEAERHNVTRRHSLPSGTNTKITSQSPRTQRLAQSGGKGGNKNDRSLLSSRDGNAKPNQAEWRR